MLGARPPAQAPVRQPYPALPAAPEILKPERVPIPTPALPALRREARSPAVLPHAPMRIAMQTVQQRRMAPLRRAAMPMQAEQRSFPPHCPALYPSMASPPLVPASLLASALPQPAAPRRREPLPDGFPPYLSPYLSDYPVSFCFQVWPARASPAAGQEGPDRRARAPRPGPLLRRDKRRRARRSGRCTEKPQVVGVGQSDSSERFKSTPHVAQGSDRARHGKPQGGC